MIRMERTRAFLFVVAISLLFAAAAPFLVRAQTSDPNAQLRETIRAALLSDPRTKAMSQAQLSAMVDILATEAQKQGVTAHDIAWRPLSPDSFNQTPAQSSGGCDTASFLCALNQAFGFTGPAAVIPIALGATSAVLLFATGMMIERYRKLRVARV